MEPRRLGRVTLEAPAVWIPQGPDALADITFGLSETVSASVARELPRDAIEDTLGRKVAPATIPPPSDEWEAGEETFFADLPGGPRPYRRAVYVRGDGARVDVTYPAGRTETMARIVPPMLESVTIAAP
jgi:hypothetical protein